MKYELSIKSENVKPHLDIEQDIQKKKDGLFTFNLRVDKGDIVDYVQYETVTVARYTEVLIEKRTVTHNSGKGSSGYAVRPDKR